MNQEDFTKLLETQTFIKNELNKINAMIKRYKDTQYHRDHRETCAICGVMYQHQKGAKEKHEQTKRHLKALVENIQNNSNN